MNGKSTSNVRKISKYICNRRPLPKRRFFYIGYRYVGPMFCEEIQDVFLKRKSKVNGNQNGLLLLFRNVRKVKCIIVLKLRNVFKMKSLS